MGTVYYPEKFLCLKNITEKIYFFVDIYTPDCIFRGPLISSIQYAFVLADLSNSNQV